MKNYSDAESAASCLQRKWEVGCQSLFSVYETISNSGIHLIEINIDDDAILGLSIFINGTEPVIVINTKTTL